jgi:type I restriction enzyme S subunit
MKENKTKPDIRFKGFTEAWEQRKLRDEAIEILAGGDIDKEKTVENGKYPIYANALTNDGIVGYYDDYYRVTAPAVTVTGRGEVGYAKARMTHFTPVVRLLAVCSNHDCYFLENAINNHKVVVESTGVPQLTVPQLSSYNIFFPANDKEEVRIGKYFHTLDNLITLHQRECDQLKELKKSMLKKMFPRDESSIPEVRFAGFTDAWEQRKLIDLCDYVDYRGKTPNKSDSGIFLVTAKNVKDGYIDYDVSKEYIPEDKYEEVMRRGKPKIGDVLITTEAPCGNVAQVNKPNIALAQRIIKYRGHNQVIDNTYLKYYLLSPFFQNILNMKSSGGTVQGIKGSVLHQQKISFTKYTEQLKIGQCLDSLDSLITLHQRELEILKNLKKTCLKRMFI